MLITDKESLSRLKQLNKLALSAAEDADTLAFFADKNADIAAMDALDTDNVEPMVHVMPTRAAVREDTAITLFTREELQKAAPESYAGYLRVPQTLE